MSRRKKQGILETIYYRLPSRTQAKLVGTKVTTYKGRTVVSRKYIGGSKIARRILGQL